MSAMQNQTKTKKGFTIVEVSLFLAVTGLMVMGVVGTVYGSVRSQRYNDSLRGVTEYFNATYSEVINPATMGSDNAARVRGASDEYAIYGKLIVFGLGVEDNDDQENLIYSASIVGSTTLKVNEKDFIDGMSKVLNQGSSSTDIEYGLFCGAERNGQTYYSTVEAYRPLWQSKINSTNDRRLRGALIIARSPSSGTVHTAYYDMSNHPEYDFPLNDDCSRASQNLREVLARDAEMTSIASRHFKMTEDVDICLRSENSSIARNIRILADGHNASAVTAVGEDDTRCF